MATEPFEPVTHHNKRKGKDDDVPRIKLVDLQSRFWGDVKIRWLVSLRYFAQVSDRVAGALADVSARTVDVVKQNLNRKKDSAEDHADMLLRRKGNAISFRSEVQATLKDATELGNTFRHAMESEA